MTDRLALFPLGSLDSSVITTVWVGVWVVAFLNLRLGWSFSGLVVPGYLVPILLVKPWAALTILVEGIVTYLVVRVLSERTPLRSWSDLFGRDRYFTFLLVSVPVRLLFDGWLLRVAGQWVNARYGLAFDYHNNLPGFGLIIIPLVANQFWKTGVVRAALPLGVPLAVTYLVTRYVLTEYTNFSIGNLQYVYGELAADLLASPKTYIIVLTTAYLASRMNQRYAWEYHGILLPALLAAEWYEPRKVAVTFAEAAVVFVLASLLLKAPLVRRMSFEGARKALFFFNVGFAYKMLLGHLVVQHAAGVKATDYFAFGYMIATLMALKAHDKGIPLRLGGSVLVVSLVGAGVGSLVGYALTFLPLASLNPAPVPRTPTDPPRGRLLDILHDDRPALYAPGEQVAAPTPQQRQAFAQALGELVGGAERRDGARRLLSEVGYDLHEIGGGRLYLREQRPHRGWGGFVFDPARPDGPAVEVPAPLAEWGTLEAGAVLFERWGGRSLAVAGGRRNDRGPSLFEVFREVVGKRNAVRLRGHPDAGEDQPPCTLRVWSGLPAGVPLADLRELIGPFEVNWEAADAGGPVAELALSRDARRALLARSAGGSSPSRSAGELRTADGNIRDWLFARRADIPGPGTDVYAPATVGDLIYFDDAVLTPIVRAVRERGDGPVWTDAQRDRLKQAAVAAGPFRYAVTLFRDTPTGTDFVVLSEVQSARRRYWGTYVFRAGGAPYLIQVPRPLVEQNSYEFGVTLFDRQRAAVFAAAGTHPEANRNHTADVSRAKSRVNLFNLVAQVVLREAGTDPLMLVQSRAFGVSPTGQTPEADVVFATDNGATAAVELSHLGAGLFRTLEHDRLTLRFADGAADTAGYGAAGSGQAGYLVQTRNKELALVWVTPVARANFRQQIDNTLQRAHFAGLDIPTVERGLADHLAALKGRTGGVSVPAALRKSVEQYATTQDVVALHAAITDGRARGLTFERLIDPDSQRAFLLIDDGKAYPLVANVGVRPVLPASAVRCPTPDADRVAEFIRTRPVWLEIGGGP